MEIKRKKDGKVKIEHNRKLFWTIVLLIIVLIAMIYYIASKEEVNEIGVGAECSVNDDCVPECNCHPEECVSINERGECPNVFCTQVCSGPLDCNAGSCGCIEGNCQVIPNE